MYAEEPRNAAMTTYSGDISKTTKSHYQDFELKAHSIAGGEANITSPVFKLALLPSHLNAINRSGETKLIEAIPWAAGRVLCWSVNQASVHPHEEAQIEFICYCMSQFNPNPDIKKTKKPPIVSSGFEPT